MTSLFISHSSKDKQIAQQVADRLESEHFPSFFLDFHPEQGIPVGRNWEQELYRKLRACDAVLFLGSSASRRSKWCFTEIAIARSLGKAILPVSIGGKPRHPLIADTQWVDLAEGEPAFRRLLTSLKELGIDLEGSFAWDQNRSPYPGLTTFEAVDAGVFFGRQDEIRELRERLQSSSAVGVDRAVAVVGSSGSGKSSLVRAGLIPRLQRPGTGWLVVDPVRCSGGGGTPVEALARALSTAFGALGRTRRWEAILQDLVQSEAALTSVIFDLRDAAGATNILLPIDQGEELFIQIPAKERSSFLAMAHAALAGQAPLWIVITLRSEFLVPARGDRHLGDVVRRPFVVGPMDRVRLREVVMGPARVAGVEFEDGLVDWILDDARQGTLPLLSYTLQRLYEGRNQQQVITKETYRQLDGVRGAVQSKTKEAIALLEQREGLGVRAIATFTNHLMTLDKRTGEAVRRRAPRREMDREDRQVVKLFEAARLLTVDGEGDDAIVEVAHEALFREWPQLLESIKRDRQFLVWHQEVESLAQSWIESGHGGGLQRDEGSLLTGRRLSEAETWLGERDSDLSQQTREFIDASRRARDSAVAREREREQAIRVSESLRLASEAREASGVEPETAFLVAWEALLWDRNELSEAVFRETLNRMPAPVRVLRHHRSDSTRRITSGFTSGGAAIFAVADDHGIVDVWGIDGASLGNCQIPGTGIVAATAVAVGDELVTYRDKFARLHEVDGTVAAELELQDGPTSDFMLERVELSAAANGTCLLHDGGKAWLLRVDLKHRKLDFIRSLTFVGRSRDEWDGSLHRPSSRVFSALLDPRGQCVLTQASDGTTRLWTLDGISRAILREPDKDNFASGRFLRGGRVVTGTFRGLGRLWDDNGVSLRVFRPAGNADLFILATDRDDQVFATTADRSGVIEVWDSAGELLSTLRGHEDQAWSAAFSPDGRHLASGSADRTVRVWDWREERQVAELHGHTDTVDQVAFHPTDSAVLLSACHAGSVRLWALDAPLLPPLIGHSRGVSFMGRTAAGVLTSESDATARLWRSSGPPATLSGGVISYAPPTGTSGPVVITRDDSGTIRLWRVSDEPDEPPVCESEIHTSDNARHAIVSPDRSRLVIVYDTAAELWSTSEERLASLVGQNSFLVDDKSIHIRGVGFHPTSGAIFTAALNGMVWLWGRDGSLTADFVADEASPDRILDTAVDPRGDYILIGIRNRARLWTWNGEAALELQSAGYKVGRVSFSPNGSHIVTIANNPSGTPSHLAEIWDRAGRRLSLLNAPDVTMYSSLRFDDGNRFLCVQSGGSVRIFDLEGGLLGTVAAARGTGVAALDISPDDQRIAVLFTDGVVRIWSPFYQRRVMSLKVGDAYGILFSADGRRLLAASPSGLIQQHALEIEDLFPAAATRVGVDRSFTQDELDRFAIRRPVRLAVRAYWQSTTVAT